MLKIIQNIDYVILKFIQTNMHNSIMDKMMPIVTRFGDGLSIWMLIGVLLVITKKYRKYGFIVVLSLTMCFVVGNLTLKPLVARIRPFETVPIMNVLLISEPTDFSFPSGHAMCSFAASVGIFYMNKKIGTFALCLSAIIGFSRLYLYVHYPSDVFFGTIIGILLGFVSIIIFNYIEKMDIKND